MGMHGAGLARMCFDADNLESLALTGYECPQTTRARQQGQVSSVTTGTSYNVVHPEVTDWRVRERMGYPPLPKAK